MKRESTKIEKISNILIYLITFLIIFLPRSHSVFKLPFVAIAIIGCITYLLKNRDVLLRNKNLLKWIILYMLINSAWVVYSILMNNPMIAITGHFRVHVLWIGVFGLFFIYLSNTEKLNYVFKAIVFANLCISIYTILIYVDTKYNLGLEILYKLDAQSRIGIHDGYVQITSSNIGSLLFTLPFIIGIQPMLSGKLRYFNILNIFITVLAVFISGRRALLLVFPIVFIILIYFTSIKIKRNKKLWKETLRKIIFYAFISLIIIMSLQVLGIIRLDVYIMRFIEGFSTNSDNVRYIQTMELIKGVKENILFGSGFGKGVEYIRTPDAPWLYEVTYAQRLYNMGIIGFSIYLVLLLVNIKAAITLIKYSDDKFILPILLGYVSFILMCFTNPYMESFDFIWILLIIPAYINQYKCKERRLNVSMLQKINILAISHHSAPYRDPVLELLDKDSNVNLKVFSMFKNDSNHTEWNLNKEKYNNNYFKTPLILFNKTALNFDIFSVLIKNDFDILIVQGHQHLTCIIAMLFCKFFNKKYVYCADTIKSSNSKGILKNIKLLFNNYLIKNASLLWVPGNASCDYFEKIGINSNKIVKGYYTLDVVNISNQIELEKELKQKEKFTFLFVGNLIPSRNVPTMVNIFRELSEKYHDLSLLIIGKGPDRLVIDRIISENKIENIKIINSVEFKDLHRYYANCDAYIHLGEEPYSLALVEAVLAGLPVVCTKKVGAVADYIENEFNGYIIDGENKSEIKSAIKNILANKICSENLNVSRNLILEESNPIIIKNRLIKAIKM